MAFSLREVPGINFSRLFASEVTDAIKESSLFTIAALSAKQLADSVTLFSFPKAAARIDHAEFYRPGFPVAAERNAELGIRFQR